MAFSRMIIRTFIGACLFVVLPANASAQRVHEVRPAAADQIRIGTESNASLNEVVSLAQRVAHNETLSADDVVANNATAMQYSCKRPNGRQYYGNNPSNCAEGTEIWTNVRRDATYRIPRTHGAILSRLRSRPHAVTQTADNGPVSNQTVQSVVVDDGRVAELQVRLDETVSQLEVAGVDLGSAQGDLTAARQALSAAHAESARLTAKLAQRETPRPITVPPPVPVATGSQQPSWLIAALLAFGGFCLGLFVYWIWLLPGDKKPLQLDINNLQLANAALEKEKVDAVGTHQTDARDLEAAKEEYRNLEGSIEGFQSEIRTVKAKTDEKVAGIKARFAIVDQELAEFHERRDRIQMSHAKLVALRVEEDRIDVHLLHIREAERLKGDAEQAGDAVMAAQNAEWAAQEQAQLDRIEAERPGFVQDLKATIATLVAQLKEDMEAQCGLAFDARASDEWKAEYQDLQQEALQRMEASKRTHDGLSGEVVAAFNALKQETLEERSRQKADLTTAQQTIADLEARVASAPNRDELAEQISEELASLKEEALAERQISKTELENRGRVISTLKQESEEAKRTIAKLTEEIVLLGGVSEEPPVEGEGSHSDIRPARARQLTVPFTATRPRNDTDRFLQPDDIHPPYASVAAVNQTLTDLLDAEHEASPRIISCNEIEARDWGVLLGSWLIRSPLTERPVPLRKFAGVIAKQNPEWQHERLRRKTDKPPPATPASSNG